MENQEVCMIIEIKIKDEQLHEQYTEKVASIVEKYDGRYLVR